MQSKEKDVYKMRYHRFTCIKELISDGVIYTPKIILFFYVCCIVMVENVYRNTQMEI